MVMATVILQAGSRPVPPLQGTLLITLIVPLLIQISTPERKKSATESITTVMGISMRGLM